jgi:hypothetical protein
MKFRISKDDQWAGPWYKRLWYNLPPLTRRTSIRWRCSVDMSRCPVGTSIKLVGTWEAWLWPGDWEREHWSHPTHEDSDRFVVAKTNDGLRVSAYGYRKAVGGVTGSSKYHGKLMTVDNGEEMRLDLTHLNGETVYGAASSSSVRRHVSFSREKRAPMRGWSFAHASGNHGEVAPARIDISIDRL